MRRLRVGHGMPRRVPRMHPSANGAPPAPRWGAAKSNEAKWQEERKIVSVSSESE
jgi:hypothetical protein